MSIALPYATESKIQINPNEYVDTPVFNRATSRLLTNDTQLKTYVQNIAATQFVSGITGSVDPEGTGVVKADLDFIVANIPGMNTIKLGMIFPFAGPESEVPSYALLCDGSAISRTTYYQLFNIIGVTYGSGDGSTTFNIPDLRGRVVLGLDNMGGTSAARIVGANIPNSSSTTWDETLGGYAGEAEHTLTTDEMPSHTHTYTHHINEIGTAVGAVATTNTPTDGPVTSTGGDEAHNNIQPVISLNYIIIVETVAATAMASIGANYGNLEVSRDNDLSGGFKYVGLVKYNTSGNSSLVSGFTAVSGSSITITTDGSPIKLEGRLTYKFVEGYESEIYTTFKVDDTIIDPESDYSGLSLVITDETIKTQTASITYVQSVSAGTHTIYLMDRDNKSSFADHASYTTYGTGTAGKNIQMHAHIYAEEL